MLEPPGRCRRDSTLFQFTTKQLRDFIDPNHLLIQIDEHLVLCRLEGRPPRLDLELYPYLPKIRVGATSARDYMTLLSGRAA